MTPLYIIIILAALFVVVGLYVRQRIISSTLKEQYLLHLYYEEGPKPKQGYYYDACDGHGRIGPFSTQALAEQAWRLYVDYYLMRNKEFREGQVWWVLRRDPGHYLETQPFWQRCHLWKVNGMLHFVGEGVDGQEFTLNIMPLLFKYLREPTEAQKTQVADHFFGDDPDAPDAQVPF